jgi:hypothetical protein
MKERIIAAQAAQLLAGLGDTPDEIAAMLLGAGYKGVQKDVFDCPCGTCLRDHFDVDVWVYEDTVKDFFNEAGHRPHVAAFVRAFDAGRYPELVRWP